MEPPFNSEGYRIPPIQCLKSNSHVVPLLLPGLGLIQTLICDGHDLLEDVADVLQRLAIVMAFPIIVWLIHFLSS